MTHFFDESVVSKLVLPVSMVVDPLFTTLDPNLDVDALFVAEQRESRGNASYRVLSSPYLVGEEGEYKGLGEFLVDLFSTPLPFPPKAFAHGLEFSIKAYSSLLAQSPKVVFCRRLQRHIKGHSVYLVLRAESAAWRRHSTVPEPLESSFGALPGSFLEAIVGVVFEEILRNVELSSNPLSSFRPTVREVTRRAARRLVAAAVVNAGREEDALLLYDWIDDVSASGYEHRDLVGELTIASHDHPALEPSLRFKTPIPLFPTRGLRKVMELAVGEVVALSDGRDVYGLGQIGSDQKAIFSIEFLGRHHWSLRCGDQNLMEVRDGDPRLPIPPLSWPAFKDALTERFPEVSFDQLHALWRVTSEAMKQRLGTMLVFHTHAAEEALRLQNHGMAIEPTHLEARYVARLTNIDGALLMDLDGRCHAAGVILDGVATDAGVRARGARYNSALRYVSSQRTAMAIVVSEDGMVDLV